MSRRTTCLRGAHLLSFCACLPSTSALQCSLRGFWYPYYMAVKFYRILDTMLDAGVPSKAG